jgi:hypothetical protein
MDHFLMVAKLLWVSPSPSKIFLTRIDMCETSRAQIALEVLSYMLANPAGRDTLEGIVEWWLLEQKIRHSTAEVKEVLDELSVKQLVLKDKSTDARVHYSVNRHREKEILAFLENRK